MGDFLESIEIQMIYTGIARWVLVALAVYILVRCVVSLVHVSSPAEVWAYLHISRYGQDADGALRVLEPVTNDSRAFFPMAVAYNMKGDWRKAEELIKKAAMAQGKQKLSGEPGDGGNNQQIEM